MLQMVFLVFLWEFDSLLGVPFSVLQCLFLKRWFRFEKTLFHSFLMLSFKICQMTCLYVCFDCNRASKWIAYCYCYHYKQGFVCKIFVNDLCCFFNTADDRGFWWYWLVFLFDRMVYFWSVLGFWFLVFFAVRDVFLFNSSFFCTVEMICSCSLSLSCWLSSLLVSSIPSETL